LRVTVQAHACNYSHGDIKSPNILITRAFIAKIADFGMSAFWKRDKGGRSAFVDPSAPSSGMSVMWAAPELFTSRQATFATDVYAFGVVLWEIATCMAPYGLDVATKEIPTIVQSGGRPDMRMLDSHPSRSRLIPKEYGELVTRCWNQEPGLRPTMKDVMEKLQEMFPLDPWVPASRKRRAEASSKDSQRIPPWECPLCLSIRDQDVCPACGCMRSARTLVLKELRERELSAFRANVALGEMPPLPDDIGPTGPPGRKIASLPHGISPDAMAASWQYHHGRRTRSTGENRFLTGGSRSSSSSYETYESSTSGSRSRSGGGGRGGEGGGVLMDK